MQNLQFYIDQYLNGRTVYDICQELQITEQNFRYLLSNKQITKTNRKKMTLWNDADIQYLKDNYTSMYIKDICNHLKRPEISVRHKANKLNIYKTDRILNPKINEFLQSVKHEKYLYKYKSVIDQYLSIYTDYTSYTELAKDLNITTELLGNIIDKANLPTLIKNQNLTIEKYLNNCNKIKNIYQLCELFDVSYYALSKFINNNNLPKPNRPKKYGIKWTTTQINRLKKYYVNHTAKECAVLLDRSYESIKSKLKELKIKK